MAKTVPCSNAESYELLNNTEVVAVVGADRLDSCDRVLVIHLLLEEVSPVYLPIFEIRDIRQDHKLFI